MTPAALTGGMNLRHAKVAAWYDKGCTWPKQLKLEGFTYQAIDAPDVKWRRRLNWIGLNTAGYSPQPYEQLASVYRRAGNENAPRVAIAKQRARRANPKLGWVVWPSRAWSAFLRWTIGYGYRPTLVVPYLAVLYVVGALVLNQAYHDNPSKFTPAKADPGQPAFHAARYTLDLLLPVANLKQRDAYVPHGYATWWVFGLSLSGWLLALILVAGLSGVFKRD
jgi:hypothetical protein